MRVLMKQPLNKILTIVAVVTIPRNTFYSRNTLRVNNISPIRPDFNIGSYTLSRIRRLYVPGFIVLKGWITAWSDNLRLVNYFKRVHSLQEYPGLYDVVKRHPSFDNAKYLELVKQIGSTKEMFFDKIIGQTEIIKGDFVVKLRDDELTYVINEFLIRAVGTTYFSQFRLPLFEEIIDSLNLRASAGLPDPSVKKKDIIDTLKSQLKMFYQGNLSITDILVMPDAIFLRPQIKEESLKTRLVYAVSATRQALESVYRIAFIKYITSFEDSELCYGITQLQISSKVQRYTQFHTYSFDYSNYDNTLPREVLIVAFHIMEKCLMLDGYYLDSFRFLRNCFLAMPAFHPTVGLAERNRGLPSGSSFTNLIGSIANFVITHITMRRYVIKHKIDNPVLSCLFCSDDNLVASNFKINVDTYSKMVKDTFGLTLKLEAYSEPGIDEAFFLGSKWSEGKPFRNVQTLLFKVLFGSGNIPKMTTQTLFISRFIDIFGNVADATIHFKHFKVPLVNRTFRNFENFYSGADFTRRPPTTYETRGLWETTDLGIQDLSHIWETR